VIHRAHDYKELVRRWRAVAKAAGVRMVHFADAAGYPLWHLRSPALPSDGGIYISAGIHGDEPGATEGLITWAERNVRRLAALPLFVFPCLNPWGLVNNIRTNEDGIDLNRAFERDDVVAVRAVRDLLPQHWFEAALILHEDYDAQGVYLYEVSKGVPLWGADLLKAASRHLALDPRRQIDISTANNGYIRPRVSPRRLAMLGGHPEATYLTGRYTARAITFETPSECALEKRAAAQGAVLDATVSLLRKVPRSAPVRRPRTSP
jgi:hypothetical protein